MKKLIATTLTLLFALSCIFSVSAFAATSEQAEPFASTYISAHSTSITPEGNGDITITYTVRAKDKMTKLGASKVVIQKKTSSSWSNVKTYTSSTTPSMIASNKATFTKDLSYSGTKGTQYRTVVTFYAENSTGSDTINETSASCTA